MVRLKLPAVVLCLSALSALTHAQCDTHSPAFPLPHLNPKDETIRKAYSKIKAEIKHILKDAGSDDISISIGVTSSKETLFDLHHTATDRDEERPGVKKVDGKSAYRIASNTKAFTVLALLQLQKAGKLNLDDPVNKYLPELDEHQTGTLPWKDITLRTLATQLSGIPRNLGLVDLVDNAGWKLLGLPDISNEHVIVCDSIWNYTRSCTVDDLYGFLRTAEPLLAPKQQSTYSNNNFVLLGLVIEKASGLEYEDYLQNHILDELKLSDTTFTPPEDSVAVLPKGKAHFFDMDFGVQNPTGGLISTSDDMMAWARYILSHYNGLSPVINWLQPQSFATGMKSFYGMPWEIFRTDEILPHTGRPVTFVTKGGGWPGYTSLVAVVPEYGLGFVILVGFSGDFSDFQSKLAGAVGQRMVEAADVIAHRELDERYVGAFAAGHDMNSSITIGHSLHNGLHITSWTSNSVDVLKGYREVFLAGQPDTPMVLQLVPTLLFKNETRQAGEIWRILIIQGQNPNEKPQRLPLTNEFCMTNLDVMAFGGKPLEEVVFWSQGQSRAFREIHLTGWRTSMQRTSPGILQSLLNVAENVAGPQAVLRKLFDHVQQD